MVAYDYSQYLCRNAPRVVILKSNSLKTTKVICASFIIIFALWFLGFGAYVEPAPPPLDAVTASNFSFDHYRSATELGPVLKKLLAKGLPKDKIHQILVVQAGGEEINFTYDPYTSVYDWKLKKMWGGPISIDCHERWSIRVFFNEDMNLKDFYFVGPC